MNRKTLIWIKLIPHYYGLLTDAKKAKSMNVADAFFKLQGWAKKILDSMNVERYVIGKENILNQEGSLFVINHQGSADAFVLVDASPVPMTAVSKIEGKKIPVLSNWYDAIDVIFFDRNNMRDSMRMMKDTAEYLRKGRNVAIFPEGTRSGSQKMGEFKGGSLKPAYNAKAPIVPIALVNSYQILDSAEKMLPVYVHFLKPIPYEEYKDLSTNELSDIIVGKIQAVLDSFETNE